MLVCRKKRRRLERWCWCQGPDDGRPMIECMGSGCVHRWFHFDCVKITGRDDDIVRMEWLCATCEGVERDARKIVGEKIGKVVDAVARPFESAAVGEALARIVYDVHRRASRPWRCAGRKYNIAARGAARSAVANILDALDPLRLLEETEAAGSSATRNENRSGARSEQETRCYRAPEWFVANYRTWYEDRLLEEDLRAAVAAIQAAKLARCRRGTKGGGRRRRGINVALSVHPEVPRELPFFEAEMVEKFSRFVRGREGLRVRKEAGERWPWSDDWVLNSYRFTNVNRENDRCTRWLRDRWTAKNPDAKFSLVVLNCALFRSFGTVDFAKEVGWIDNMEDFLNPKRAVEAAETVWRGGYHAFTRAYCRPYFNSEMNKDDPPLGVYAQAFAKVARLAEELVARCDELESSDSWRSLAAFIRSVKGFGGTGFVAKELLLDVMGWHSLRQHVRDDDDWTLPGPGARRGLNRLSNRELNWGIYAPAESRVEEYFIEEIRLLYRTLKREGRLPSTTTLKIHDVQFALCEYDKYERVSAVHGKGKSLPKYQPLDGTKFNTKDGKPPEHVTCRPKTQEWNVPLHLPPSATRAHLATPSPSKRKRNTIDK